MTSEQFSQFLDVLIEKSADLRKQGVLSFDVGGSVVQLNPQAGDLVFNGKTVSAEDYDPMEDPTSYGQEPGTVLPWQEGDEV